MYRRLLSLGIFLFIVAAAAGSIPAARAENGGSISGRVVQDLNGDGIVEPDEPGLAGWRVVLESGAVWTAKEVRTDSDGSYVFRDQPPGDYEVSLPCDGQPSAWAITGASAFSGVLEPGGNRENLDFPVKLMHAPKRDGSLSGRLAWDEDGDAIPELSEAGIAGWTVSATIENPSVCVSDEPDTAVSDPDGSFHFANMLPGSYQVYVEGPVDSSGAAHWAIDAPGTTQDCGGYQCFQVSYSVQVPAGGNGTIVYGVLALEGSGSISGSIYRDLNENGRRDPDDPLLDGGCQIGLVYRTSVGYSAVLPDTFTAPSEGLYRIANLPAGSYTIGCLFGPGGPAINPPAGPNGYPEHLITLAEGQATVADFGFGPQPLEPGGEPLQLTPTPEATATPQPPAVIGAPETGSGSTASTGGGPLLWTAAALVATGAVGLALGLRRRERRL